MQNRVGLSGQACIYIYIYSRSRRKRASFPVFGSRARFMDPSTGPTRSPISTNQRREMLLFLARIFGSHAGITKPARHTLTQCGFVGFGSIVLTQQNGCMGAYRVIDLEQFPVRISTDKAPTPLTKFGICSFFFFFFCHSPFFLSFFVCIALPDSWRFSPF